MKKFLVFLIFSLAFFVPRYFAHLQYDALEDEILSINNNLVYSTSEQLLAPDFTHPPLWYLLMEYPTSLLRYEYSIGYYRLIQISILFLGLLFTVAYFWRKIPHRFIIIFLLLFLTNTELIHLTSQHRMYSLVLSFGVFYVFDWLYLIKYKLDKKWQDFFALGIISALGFFSNYSMIWLIPIFPFVYLLSGKFEILKQRIKNLFIFITTFFVSVSWFIPIFIKNSLTSIDYNQWTSDLNYYNVFQLFVNYFGIVPIQEEIRKIGTFAIIFIVIFILILFSQLFLNKEKYIKIIFLGSFISFLFFLLTTYLTGNSLLYPRTAICIVLGFYALIASSFGSLKYSKVLVTLLIIIQLSQFFLYFNQVSYYYREYFFMDYRHHPINYFANYNFPPRSCLFTVPIWNDNAVKYFLDNKVLLVDLNLFDNIESAKLLKTDKCEAYYLLEQFSLGEKGLEEQYQIYFPFDFNRDLIEQYANQNLYLLSNKVDTE